MEKMPFWALHTRVVIHTTYHVRVDIPVPCDLVESNKLAPLHGEQLPGVQHRHATVPCIEHHKELLEGNDRSWKIRNTKRKQKSKFKKIKSKSTSTNC